jgi:hypothetical protein
VPTVAPVTRFNKEPAELLLIPAKLAMEFTNPPTLSPKIEDNKLEMIELLEDPPNKFPKIPLDEAFVIASTTPGLSALLANPPTTAGNKPPIALKYRIHFLQTAMQPVKPKRDLIVL